MALFDWLNNIDTNMFLALHGGYGDFFDAFFTFFTSKETWIPLYLILIYTLYKVYKPKWFWIIFFFILTIAAADQLSGLIKDLVQRPRPSHVEALSKYLNLPTGTGGAYGFVSSHAANAFALAVLTGLVSQSRRLWVSLMLWALLTSYSRIYVGVHYPFDVICGGLIGGLIAWFFYTIMRWADRKWWRKRMHHTGRWKGKDSKPIVLALCVIVATLLVVSFVLGKYYSHI